MNFVPYVIVFFLIYISSFYVSDYNTIRKNKDNYVGYLFLLSSLVLFFGCRGFIYTDWINYAKEYNQFPNSFSRFISNFSSIEYEPGFAFFLFLCKLFRNYFFLQFFSFLIDLVILLKALQKLRSSNIALFFLFFITFKGIEIEFNLLRNSKSIMLFVYSLYYVIKERNFKTYFFINLIGALFHVSALLYIPLYFFIKHKFHYRFYLSVFVLGLSVFALRIPICKRLIEFICSFFPNGRAISHLIYYLDSETFSAPVLFSTIYIERIGTFFLMLVLYRKLVRTEENIYFINILTLYYIVCLFCWDFYVIVQRVTVLFICSSWFIFPEMIKLFKDKRVRCLIVFICFIYGSFKLYKDTSIPIMKYSLCFFEKPYAVKEAQTWKYLK